MSSKKDRRELTPAQTAWLADFQAWLERGAELHERITPVWHHRRLAPEQPLLLWARYFGCDLKRWLELVKKGEASLELETPPGCAPTLRLRRHAKVTSLLPYLERRAAAGGRR